MAYFIWDVDKGKMDKSAFEGVSTIIHLAGAGVADKKWQLKNETDKDSPLMKKYRCQENEHVEHIAVNKGGAPEPVNAAPVGAAAIVPWSAATEETTPAPQKAAVAAPAAPAPASKPTVSAAPVSSAPAGAGQSPVTPLALPGFGRD